jgi:hypothetical protein
MNRAQERKIVRMGGPATASTSATAAYTVDTIQSGNRFEQAVINVVLPPASATNSSAKWTSLVLQHGTTTDATNCTAISNMTGTTNSTATTAQFVLPANNDTSAVQVVSLHVDMRDKERILRLVGQCPAAHSTVFIWAELHRGKSVPSGSSDEGAATSVYG